jgi:hypothetical protein
MRRLSFVERLRTTVLFMMNFRTFVRTWTFVLTVAACMLLPKLPATEAAGPSASPSLIGAAAKFGPLPTSRLFTVETLEEVRELAREEFWKLPEQRTAEAFASEQLPRAPRPVDELWHTVGERESKYRIREMYRGRLSRYEELNPGVDFDNLEHGQQIKVWERRTDLASHSIGVPHRGRLFNGEPLAPGENYVILYQHRTFGAPHAVAEIQRVLDTYGEQFPGAHPLMVGDISFRTGRHIRPHRSHQSGRDVDISYPRYNPPPNFKRFHHVRRRNLDVEKTFWLMKSFIDGGYVEYVFMDRYFQRLLIEEARRQGAPEEWIDAVFQYPHWSGGKAIIRHARGHKNHFHIRFKCHPSDRRCRD